MKLNKFKLFLHKLFRLDNLGKITTILILGLSVRYVTNVANEYLHLIEIIFIPILVILQEFFYESFINITSYWGKNYIITYVSYINDPATGKIPACPPNTPEDCNSPKVEECTAKDRENTLDAQATKKDSVVSACANEKLYGPTLYHHTTRKNGYDYKDISRILAEDYKDKNLGQNFMRTGGYKESPLRRVPKVLDLNKECPDASTVSNLKVSDKDTNK